MDTLLTGLKAAADRTRLRLLALCAGGELTVSELVRILGHSQPVVSRHLRILVDAGLLERFREGTWVFHRLAANGNGAGAARRLVAMLPEEDVILAGDGLRRAGIKAERERAAALYFRDNAPRWNRVRSLYVDEAEVEEVLVGLLAHRGIDDLLDIGTGTGRLLEVLGPLVSRAQGIDLSRDMLAVARANLDRAGLGGCTVRQADMYRLPFAAASFDAATIHQVLHFADHPASAVAEAARVLRPGGYLLVADFAPHDLEFLRDEHEHRRLGFADDEVEKWFAACHLDRVQVRHLHGDPLTVTVWLAVKPKQPNAQAAEADGREQEHDPE